MPQSISVVVIDKDVDAINRVVSYMKNLGDSVTVEGVATTFDQGFELIHKKRPMVVILDVCEECVVDTDRISRILSRFPQTTIFATCVDSSSDAILKTMRAGASEYLLKPVSEADLGAALQKLGRLWIVKPVQEEQAGKVITVFSPKGGVGVTTIATNLAIELHKQTRRPTILVDLDLHSGDVTTFLDLKPAYTISDVTVNIARLDKAFLKGVITQHSSGVFVLAEPHRVEEAVSISGDDLFKVIGLLRTMFSYIVIDTEPVIDERTQLAIKTSDVLLIAFILSLPGIRNMQRYINYFTKLGYRDKLKLVVNRYVKKGEIRVEEAERILNFPVAWKMPNDYEDAMACLNRGVPLGEGAPRSHLYAAINELSKALTAMKAK